MKLSKYIIHHVTSKGIYWFSTINGTLLKMSSSTIPDNPDAVNWLKTNHFIIDQTDDESTYIQNEYTKKKSIFESTLFLTVEITTACNFTCNFCYQASWNNRKVISMSVIDALLRLLNASDTGLYTKLQLNIIGGEPLLFPNTVIYLLESMASFTLSRNLAYEVKLNSNGLSLSPSFIRNILPATSFMFPFLSPSDYSNGIVRLKSNQNGLYEALLVRINSWKDAFNEDSRKEIVFRYNLNEVNLIYFEKYVDFICSLGFTNFRIDLVNTADCDFNNYKNLLSQEDFDNWYYKIAIPILIKRNIAIPIKPRCELSRCKARRIGSFKLFADGRIGLCNGIEYDESLPMIGNIKSLYDINNIFYDIKTYNYILDDNKCKKCDKVYLCGGPSPCKGRICRGNITNINKYIECYAK